jgi:hypothetical protein
MIIFEACMKLFLVEFTFCSLSIRGQNNKLHKIGMVTIYLPRTTCYLALSAQCLCLAHTAMKDVYTSLCH